MTITHVETGSALAVREDQTGWTPQQRAALAQLGVKDASDGDLAVFFHQVQRTGLDPFARQVYMIGRQANENIDGRWVKSTKWTIQTGIDGFRLIARRASDAARETYGYAETLWCGEDGRWVDVWLSHQPPAAAKVTVYRNGQPFPAVALFREYAVFKQDGSPTKMWAEKGSLMLAKCAEALALRKAFPQDLSGLYTSDEMDRSNREGEAAAPAPSRVEYPAQATSLADAIAAEEPPSPEPLRTAAQARELNSLLRELSMTGDPAAALRSIGEIVGRTVANTKTLTVAECDDVIAELQTRRAYAEADAAAADAQPEIDGPLVGGAR